MTDQATRDRQLREVLDELSAGRLLTGEAFEQVKKLQDEAVAEAAAETSGLATRRSRKKSAGGGIVAGLIMVLIGGIFAGVGGFFGFKSIRFELQGKQVEGQVIRMIGGGGNNKGSKPLVAYKVDGKAYEIEGTISASPPAYKQGEKATVYYDPTDPSDAQIGGFVERWLFPTIFGGLGGLVCIVGLVMFFGGILRRIFRPLTSLADDLDGARFTAG